MEPNSYHKADDWDDDDNASMEVDSDSFRVEFRIEVFHNLKSVKEHQVDIEVSTTTRTKYEKQ